MRKLFSVFLWFLATFVFAQNLCPTEEQEEEKPLSARIELSYVNTSGNTETQTFSQEGKLEYEGDLHRIFLKNSYLYVKKGEEETANKFKAEGRWEILLTEHLFTFMSGGYERDKFSGYTYKWNGGPGMGYDLIKTDGVELKILLSLLYYYNKVENGTIDNYSTSKAEAIFSWKMRDNLEFKQNLNYIVNNSRNEVYFINSESSIEVKITDLLSLGVNYKVYYQNTPPEPGIERTDTVFSTSLIFDF